MTQKLTISALDHGKAVADEILDGVSERRCFPGLVGDATHAEEDFGDLAITRAVGPAIDGLQHMARAAQLLAGQSGVLWNDTPMKRLEKASNRFGTIETIRVDRYEGSQRLGSIDAAQADQVQRLPVHRPFDEAFVPVFERHQHSDLRAGVEADVAEHGEVAVIVDDDRVAQAERRRTADALVHLVRDVEMSDELIAEIVKRNVYVNANMSSPRRATQVGMPSWLMPADPMLQLLTESVGAEELAKLGADAANRDPRAAAAARERYAILERSLAKLDAAGANVVLGAFDTGRPCKKKVNRPPSDAALAIAAELLGDRGADPVIDLDVYRRAIEGDEGVTG